MNGVLLLDQSFQPLRVIPVKRAVGLMLAGKVEGVTDEFIETRSASDVLEIPIVLRLGYAVKMPFRKSEVPCNRRGVLARDNHTCQFITHEGPCNAVATTIDHIHPKSRGGDRLSWTNLVAACSKHNAKKGDRTLEEVGWKLKRKPEAPRTAVRVVNVRGDVPEAWAPFLAV